MSRSWWWQRSLRKRAMRWSELPKPWHGHLCSPWLPWWMCQSILWQWLVCQRKRCAVLSCGEFPVKELSGTGGFHAMRKSSLYLPDLTQFWLPSISLVAGRVHQSHLCEVGAIEWNSWSIKVGLCILRWRILVDRWCPHCNRTGARDASIWGQRVWCVVCHLSLVHLCGLCGFASGLYQSQCLLTRKHQRNCETTLVGTTTCFTPLVVASCDAQFDRLGHVLGCLCVPNRTLEGGVLSNRSATS